jgi:uncharacterized membrane protein
MSETLTPEELGRALREEEGPFLKNRRWIVGLALYNILAMSAISLYQMGILKSVPEVHLPGEDADKINGSAQAYEILQTPDAVLAIGSYAATAALAAMGPPDRATSLPWPALGMGVKALADAAFAVKLLIDQPTKYKAYCSWCVTGALASLAVVPLAWPEARAAWNQLRGNEASE